MDLEAGISGPRDQDGERVNPHERSSLISYSLVNETRDWPWLEDESRKRRGWQDGRRPREEAPAGQERDDKNPRGDSHAGRERDNRRPKVERPAWGDCGVQERTGHLGETGIIGVQERTGHLGETGAKDEQKMTCATTWI
ncbi:uncharacterized protein LOC144652320 isoform X1 [Oculina patagonica]